MTAEKNIKNEEKSIKLNESSSNALKIHNSCHRKIYIPMETDKNIKVGMKEILQHPTKNSDGTTKENPPIPVYDTSGPYSDDNYEIDLDNGIRKLRAGWVADRDKKYKDNCTQMHLARKGIITPEMEYIAIRENIRLERDWLMMWNPCSASRNQNHGAHFPEQTLITPEFVRDEVARRPSCYSC